MPETLVVKFGYDSKHEQTMMVLLLQLRLVERPAYRHLHLC